MKTTYGIGSTLLVGALSIGTLGSLGLAGCSTSDEDLLGDQVKIDDEHKSDSSAQATFLDFRFKGSITYKGSAFGGTESFIEDQLFYTIGHLNGDNSVGRLDKVKILSSEDKPQPDGSNLINYEVILPVAWGSKTNLPRGYQFRLPRDLTSGALDAFTTKYSHSCVDFGAHDVDSGSMWYYYRPEQSGCHLADADVTLSDVQISPSENSSTGKYPEYHMIWNDRILEVVAVFGKNEDGQTSPGDPGISAFNRFTQSMRSLLSGSTLTTIPASVPSSPGVENPDVQFNATLANGDKVKITALLVDNVRTGSTSYDFDTRYKQLSTTADLIMYNGHAGLGDNVRALARKGSYVAKKYLIVFMNGCDTYAYVDGTLAEQRALLNPDDPTGMKYMEIVTNAMPAFFHQLSNTTTAMVKGLMAKDAPVTYEQIFKDIDSSQVVLVTGDQDNVYFPGFVEGGGGTGETWAGMNESVRLRKNSVKRWETPVLAIGKYVIEMSGTGDADLYLRTGVAPSTTEFECRPFKSTSKERCVMNVTSPAPLHIMARGNASSSTVRIIGKIE